MRGLWSMAAQLRACRCRGCLPPTDTSTPTRRVTANMTSNRRHPKALTSRVFSACYSAMPATATAVDASYADNWQPELDDRIADDARSMAGLLGQNPAGDLAQIVTSPYPDVPHLRPPEKTAVIRDICKLKGGYLRDLHRKRRQRLASVKVTSHMVGLNWNQKLPTKLKTTLARCEEVLNAEGKEFARLGREPKTEEQMEKMSEMITDLVDRLMVEAWWSTEAQSPGAHPALHSPDSANTMIRMLRSDGYPSYSHPNADLANTASQRALLNEVNLKILEGWAPPIRERLVAKICYNILVCGVPPGIQNYNLLILGFSVLGEHNLAQAVVDSLLNLSRLKPTEATYLCLLQHYRLKGDIVGFRMILKRLFGHDPRGMNLGRRPANDVARFRKDREWVATHDAVAVGNYYVARVPFTQDVAAAIMEGLIDFHMLREAAKIFSISLQKGWCASNNLVWNNLMWRMFHSCLTFFDAQSAQLIIRALLDNIDQASSMLLDPRDENSSHTRIRQIHHLLNVGQAEGLPGEVSVSGERKANLDRLVTAIWIREALLHAGLASEWLRKATRTLKNKNMPLNVRLDRALSALSRASEWSGKKRAKAEQIRRLAKMDWLARQAEKVHAEIQSTEKAISNLLAHQIPEPLRTSLHFDPRVPIAERIESAVAHGIPGTMEYAAAACFEMSKEIDFRTKEALIRALPVTYAKGLQQEQNNTGDVALGRIVAYFEHYFARLQDEKAVLRKNLSKDGFAVLFKGLPQRMMAWKGISKRTMLRP